MALGFIRFSPSEIVGNSSGSPPASRTPRFTAAARPRKCRLQFTSSDHEVQIPTTRRLRRASRDRPSASVDALEPGDVVVVSTCRGSYWGELLATASAYRGANGVVLDAYTRDTLALIEMDFPTFAAGIHCADSLGRIDVDEVGIPINCGGVTVNPGDLVLGDHDGVVVIPAAAAEEIVTLAEEKVAGENLVRAKLAEGMPVAEAFRTYGVI